MQNINKGAGQRNLIAYFAIMAMQASVVSYLCNISAGSCAYAMLKEGQTKKKGRQLCAVKWGMYSNGGNKKGAWHRKKPAS